MSEIRHDVSLLGDQDLHLFNEGTHHRAYQKLGSHVVTRGGETGTVFAVWAPNADEVTVMGEFNGWDKDSHPLALRGTSGIWEGFVPGLGRGTLYKYHLRSKVNEYEMDKADPYGLFHELPPKTGSVVWDLDYEWGDADWMRERREGDSRSRPVSVYELHAGSWMRVPGEGHRSLSYRELAHRLGDYVEQMGFTHVELMPVMEHPFFGSWGYQITGYFAPSSRYGTPQDFMYLVDHLHQRGIGVILDWVPSHFPRDIHGLHFFDGTHLYEHEDPRQGIHRDWDSHIFNYGRHEVRSFLMSNALFWLDAYHIDGLRVDAVASMLYLDYSRQPGDWIPNEHGGRENLEAIGFLRSFNSAVFGEHPGVQTIAEESTSWPMVSRPTYVGGLGFGMKWDMGWMHDTLEYMRFDPIHRKFHHNLVTFRMMYAYSENFVLALSHDEVVHGKSSLVGKMAGDEWQKLANLRLLFGYMHAQPGKKLVFMGGEIAQWSEWNHDGSVEWHLLEHDRHRGVQAWVAHLNRLHRGEPALHELDLQPGGFEWVDCNDGDNSVLTMLRMARSNADVILIACNFTPIPRPGYVVGVPRGGFWREIANSDAFEHGGAGWGNMGGVEAAQVPAHGRPWSLTLTLPPLSAIFLKSDAPPA